MSALHCALSGQLNGVSTLGSAHFTFAWLQQDSAGDGKLVFWVALAACSLAVVALFFLVAAIAVLYAAMEAKKTQAELMRHVNELKAKLMPLIDKSHTLVNDLTPQIKDITQKVNDITGHVGEIVVVAKDKVNEFAPTISQVNVSFQEALGKAKATFDDANATVGDVNQKTRKQVERINGMVSGVLDATTQMGKAIQHGIGAPGREIAGIVSGAKAGVDTLLKNSSSWGGQIAGKIASLFAKQAPAARKPAPAYRTNPAPANVKPFGSMANAGGSGTAGPLEPGVSSGSTGNGDPILS